MLVITRKLDETIVLPELGVEIRVLKTQGGGVRLGIEAPQTVSIRRGELLSTDNADGPSCPSQKKKQLQAIAEPPESYSVSS